MADCKPVDTPMLPGLKLTKEDSLKTPDECREMEKIPYINAVGSLMYLATNDLSRHCLYSWCACTI